MRSPVTASERDLRTLAGIVTDERADVPAEGLPPSLLTELTGLVRCDQVSFFGMDSHRQEFPFVQEVPVVPGGEAPRGLLGTSPGLRGVQLSRAHRRPAQHPQGRGLLLRPAVAQHRHVRRLLPAAGDRA